MNSAPLSGPIDLAGKSGIVTGAARGIGRAVCLSLAREGASVAACDILPCVDTVAEAASRGWPVFEIPCDVSDMRSAKDAVDKAKKLMGSLDFLVNNAGILGRSGKPIEDYGFDEWKQVLDINLNGTFIMTQAVWPYMRGQGRGKIVCIGSIAGRIGGLLAGPHYCASKGGIHAFVKWAAKNGALHGIYVNGIAPGPIETPMIENEPYGPEMVPLGRLGNPNDIAEAVVFLVSQASNFITGTILDVNGGMLMV
ncbi:MAG: SDR family oxidoreductase [Desulfobacteraceae bacterium]|jgi:NAD(P)-dependent dehydrogenase (short-subunit alcohol dehydrogenase family)|nr:MAG: SDR family oxidoreductase [Desulfobacteraceae bacterium]